MKKILTLFLVLALALALSVPALAANETSGSTELTTTVGQNYVISIPATQAITAGTLSTAMTAIKLTQANLPAGGKVNVTLTTPSGTVNTYKLTNAASDEIDFAVNSTGAAFASGDLANLTDTINLTIDIAQAEWDAAPTGDYTGTVSFTVAYVAPTGP